MKKMDPTRARILKTVPDVHGAVAYWMNRDQRVRDNWALLHAQQIALETRMPLVVVHCLPEESSVPFRQHGFSIKNLMRVQSDLEKPNIPFAACSGSEINNIQHIVKRYNIGSIVVDFSPLRKQREILSKLVKSLRINIIEVDAHNIVPCWVASGKQEYTAGTLRPKIHRVLDQYLTDFPRLSPHPFSMDVRVEASDWKVLEGRLSLDRSVGEIDWLKPGEREAIQVLDEFLEHRLLNYDADRNDPVKAGQSNLSPYLHFGQISAQRIALEVMRHPGNAKVKDAFLEELIVRRELADNFCCFNPLYDRAEGFPRWAQQSLSEHLPDKRDYIYSTDEFERGLTHDPLWNAAQQEMVSKGKMHGYMRMYWAKKILEWSRTPEDAMEAAIFLNDKYELDGRDPNGYAGIAWSIGGVHDRAWFSRPVYGKVRYMNSNGCRSKFDVEKYIERNIIKKEHESLFAL
jgi:deoxyribodipyrimidine photo-lyase